MNTGFRIDNGDAKGEGDAVVGIPCGFLLPECHPSSLCLVQGSLKYKGNAPDLKEDWEDDVQSKRK